MVARVRLFRQNHDASAMEIGGSDYHYLVHVLRLKEGEHISLVGEGAVETECLIRFITKDRMILEPLDTHLLNTAPQSTVVLLCGVGKGKKLEEVVRATTALGVSAVIPFVGENSVAQRSNPRLPERLTVIAEDACRQSCRPKLPELFPVQNDLGAALETLNQHYPQHQLFWLNERGGVDLVMELGRVNRNRPVGLVCGPEGGFSPNEQQMLEKSAGSITLGPRILRMELAATVAVAITERVLSAYQGTDQKGPVGVSNKGDQPVTQ